MRKRRRFSLCAGSLAAACYLICVSGARAVDHPDLFELASADFLENGLLTEANAAGGDSPRGPWACGGQNISPGLTWFRPPAETQSFAIVMDDPDAAMGRGGNHWVMYDIPADVRTVARGDADKRGKFVGGNSGSNNLAYHGPCAEPGAKAHHFLFMIYALDIGLGRLKPGLTRAELAKEIAGHNLAEASVMARYQRAADGKAISGN
jgi:Raf kinase inhibitor-like YbhB/YbcL family protein